MQPALALLEFDSIAVGIEAGDAMAKRAPIDVLYAGTVHPGHYLVLVAGAVGDVEEALDAGREIGSSTILDTVLLPNIHPDVVEAIRGRRRTGTGEALGVIETPTVASIIDAADAGMKGARVRLLELRLADDLGGKGYLLFDGPVAEVEAAVELGVARVRPGVRTMRRIIHSLHPEMRDNLEADARFSERVRSADPTSDAGGSRGAGRSGRSGGPGKRG
jgi:microcompartment protein CcmL/EutN